MRSYLTSYEGVFVRIVPFTRAEIYGMSDEGYTYMFTTNQLQAIVARYKVHLALLQNQKRLVRQYYIGNCDTLPQLTHVNTTSIIDIEDLGELIDDKIISVEDSLDAWTKRLEDRLEQEELKEENEDD